MHIEPGLVEGGKLLIGYGTGAAALAWAAREAWRACRASGPLPMVVRTMLATLAVMVSFQVLPHPAVGVSEVHLIMGTTLLMLFGLGPAAIGLAAGLAAQGLLWAPADLPQYGMNVTSLLVPLAMIGLLARRIVPASTPYVDLRYSQALRLSLVFQGGIVLWVAFWALTGGGAGSENMEGIFSFGAAYLAVVLLEPLFDLGVLWGAKMLRGLDGSALVHARLHRAVP